MNILVTGGASGLGESITRMLAKQGHKVYFTYNKSISNAKIIQSENKNTSPIQCDFKDEIQFDSLLQEISGMDLDVLINNAYSGEFLKTHFHKIDPNDFLNDFKNNLIPTVRVTQATIKVFRKKRKGKIITVLTSALLNTPPIGSSVYIANKAYLGKLTKVWAIENIKFNITSNSVSPSLMRTNLTNELDDRMIEQIENNHPLKKLLNVDDVPQTINFLVDAPSHINGQDIVINAGENIR